MTALYVILAVSLGVVLLSIPVCQVLGNVGESPYWRHPHAVRDTVAVIATVVLVPALFAAAALVALHDGAIGEDSAMLMYFLGTILGVRIMVRLTAYMFRNKPDSVMNDLKYRRRLLLPLIVVLMAGATTALFLAF